MVETKVKTGKGHRCAVTPRTTSSRSATTSSRPSWARSTRRSRIGRTEAHRRHDGRPAGLRQDDHRRQARDRLPQARGSGRCSSPPTCTAPPPWSSSSVLGEQLGVPGLPRAGHRPARAVPPRPRARPRGRRPTSSSTTPPAASPSTTPLMQELEQIKAAVAPENILLVCDAMIGQDAVQAPRPSSTGGSASTASSSPSSTATPAAARPSPSRRSPASPSSSSAWARRSTGSRSSAPRGWPAASSASATSSA